MLLTLLLPLQLLAQEEDSTLLTNKDAIFTRPFVLQGTLGKTTTAVGGYLEGNTNYFVTDGVGDGFSMELRRFNIFLYSTIGPRIKFLSELEFEHGTEEIKLETALLDFEIHPAFIFRGGIILPPIGYFNQNHDGPKWEFIDRPLVSTSLIPATLSEVGFGFHGKIPFQTYSFTYETYIVNGLQDGIVANETNRTFIPAGKTEEMFAEDNNGTPSFTGRIAAKKRKTGEIGLSLYAGPYNTFKADGFTLDEKRKVNIYAFDYNVIVQKLQILGEAAFAQIDVPPVLGQQFGSRQWGMHSDFIYPVLQRDMLRWEDMTLNASFRFEYVDYNIDTFAETGDKISDEITAIVPGLSLRFSANTLLRANFRYHWEKDILGNPAARTAGFQFGFATYF